MARPRLIRIAVLVQPRHGHATVRVVAPQAPIRPGAQLLRRHQPDLVAVVDGGHARQGGDQGERAAQPRQRVRPVVVAAVHRRVVALRLVVEQKQRAGGRLQRVHPAGKGGGGDGRQHRVAAVVVVVAQLRVAPKLQHRAQHQVVGPRVPSGAVVDRVAGEMPRLADDARVGVLGLDCLAKAGPEIGGQLLRRVQPPAVRPGRHRRGGVVGVVRSRRVGQPPPGDGVVRPEHIHLHRRILAVEAGSFDVGADEGEEIVIRAVAGGARADGAALPLEAAIAIEQHRVAGGGAEDAVQDDVHATAVCLLGQSEEQVGAAEGARHTFKVGHVVAGVRRRLEHRHQIQDVDAEVLQVIQFVQDALQIAAVELILVGTGPRAVRLLRVVHRLVPGRVVEHGRAVAVGVVGRGVIAAITVAEAVRQDVVHRHAVLEPIGGGKLRVIGRVIQQEEGAAPPTALERVTEQRGHLASAQRIVRIPPLGVGVVVAHVHGRLGDRLVRHIVQQHRHPGEQTTRGTHAHSKRHAPPGARWTAAAGTPAERDVQPPGGTLKARSPCR
eukprot:ctg_2071.g429